MRVDVVRELIDRLLSVAQREGTLTESLALEVERQFRREYRGAEYVVSVTPRGAMDEKKAAVVSDYLARQPIDEITNRHGISRAALYRYLKS